ncbi:TlpA family protein disulfide reductase [Myroides odoratus]|uniref:Uncharacterized protein n=1 Tax=Myroides odoratus TaxID=256 RepID=A0A378RMN8_MYROD|nr:redoxin domain-containing protein [Myroides odoratus]QQU04924.1 redoxin domain-containing protein [Myroides odoratus]STZ27609.1 Uncharacterised protein [Myroides odoratus]
MIKSLSYFILFVLFFSCKKGDDKENYIKDKIPMLYTNLNHVELDSFKNRMLLKDEKLLSFDMNLLRKGTKNDFDSILVNITRDLGGNIEKIILTDSVGKETKINSEKFILTALNGEHYILSDFNNDKTYIIMISTSCGFCLQSFKKLNEIVENDTEKKKKYVAIFQNTLEEVENYKKGYSIDNFGFLNDRWIKFTKENDFSKKLNFSYNPYEDGYPTLLYKNKNSREKVHQSKEIYRILTH